jgi:hypothetical protein
MMGCGGGEWRTEGSEGSGKGAAMHHSTDGLDAVKEANAYNAVQLIADSSS